MANRHSLKQLHRRYPPRYPPEGLEPSISIIAQINPSSEWRRSPSSYNGSGFSTGYADSPDGNALYFASNLDGLWVWTFAFPSAWAITGVLRENLKFSMSVLRDEISCSSMWQFPLLFFKLASGETPGGYDIFRAEQANGQLDASSTNGNRSTFP